MTNDAPPNGKFRQGYYTPTHPEKYMGDISKIFYRSSWELHAFKFMDKNPNVLQWGSEVLQIPYPKPVPMSENAQGWRKAIYYPDIYVIYQNRKGQMIREVVEIKPAKQARPSRSKLSQRKLQEDYVYAINQIKWAYAKEWCEKRGMKFSLLTEKNGLFKL